MYSYATCSNMFERVLTWAKQNFNVETFLKNFFYFSPPQLSHISSGSLRNFASHFANIFSIGSGQGQSEGQGQSKGQGRGQSLFRPILPLDRSCHDAIVLFLFEASVRLETSPILLGQLGPPQLSSTRGQRRTRKFLLLLINKRLPL